MRLITIYKNLLLSTNSDAQFENNLEDDLPLKPYSKLALISSNIKYNDSFIEINQFNNRLSTFISQAEIATNTNPVLAEINTGKYTLTQWFEELQRAMNSGYISTAAGEFRAGMSNNIFIDDKNKFSIQYGRNNITPMLATGNGAKITVVNTTNPKTVTRVDTQQAYSAFAQMTPTPINKGSGRHLFNIITQGANQKFIIGVINDKINLTEKQELNKDDYTVYISNDNAQNRYEINGTITSTAVQNTDNLQILFNGGKISFNLGGNPLGGLEIDYRDNLGKVNNFLYCSLKGQNTQIGFTTYRSDPFFITPPLNSLENVGVNPIGTYLKLSFIQPNPSNILWQTLGYPAGEITLSSVLSTFTGTKNINFELAEDSGVNIVTENLRLSSFNFSESVAKPQSILHHIPEGLRDDNGVLSYVAGNLIKINLNNEYPLNVRNLRLSIRNAKDNSVISADEVSLCLVALDENE